MKQLATWSSANSAWVTVRHLCGHWAAYSETLPKSGITRDGKLYAPAVSEQSTTASACSSSPSEMTYLRTPCASDSTGGVMEASKANQLGYQVKLSFQLFELFPAA